MGRFSQTFVAYHDCGNCYQDGTNKIVPKNRRCIQQTYNPFWKKPSDVRNKVETRAQLKIKTKASRNFQRRYFKWLKMLDSEEWDRDILESDTDSDTDLETWESDSDTDISLANNASETEQKLSDEETKDKLVDTKINIVNPSAPKIKVVNSSTPESLANNITIYSFTKEPVETAGKNNKNYLSP